jgi:hypothetical protein
MFIPPDEDGDYFLNISVTWSNNDVDQYLEYTGYEYWFKIIIGTDEQAAIAVWETLVLDCIIINGLFNNPRWPEDFTGISGGLEWLRITLKDGTVLDETSDRFLIAEDEYGNQYYYLRYTEQDLLAEYRGIRYGDYEWMQEKLHSLYTPAMLDRYFSYDEPGCGYIYRDGSIYALDIAGGGGPWLRMEHMRLVTFEENLIEMSFPQVHWDDAEYLIDEEIYPPIFIRLINTGGRWKIDEYSNIYTLFSFSEEEMERYASLAAR